MSVAVGTVTTISTDRFYGNELIGCTLAIPKTVILHDSAIAVAVAGDLNAVYDLINREDKLVDMDIHELAPYLKRRSKKFNDVEYIASDGYTMYEISNTAFAQMEIAAIGAGYQYALGAWHILHSTKQAVEAAAAFCPMVQLPIDTFQFDSKAFRWDKTE